MQTIKNLLPAVLFCCFLAAPPVRAGQFLAQAGGVVNESASVSVGTENEAGASTPAAPEPAACVFGLGCLFLMAASWRDHNHAKTAAPAASARHASCPRTIQTTIFPV